jgi:histidine triad (HIT) family protein
MASIFTKIINREIPAEIIFENNNIIVIKDINPEAKTHLLIIPKEEIPSINDLTIKDNNLLIELFEVAKNIAKELNIEE